MIQQQLSKQFHRGFLAIGNDGFSLSSGAAEEVDGPSIWGGGCAGRRRRRMGIVGDAGGSGWNPSSQRRGERGGGGVVAVEEDEEKMVSCDEVITWRTMSAEIGSNHNLEIKQRLRWEVYVYTTVLFQTADPSLKDGQRGAQLVARLEPIFVEKCSVITHKTFKQTHELCFGVELNNELKIKN